jgi:nucleoside-diphosphate-sugar epimerase
MKKFPNKKNILLAGASGMLGQAIYKNLKKKGKKIFCPSSKKLNLKNFLLVKKYLKKNKINYVINCAGKVGGILDNKNNQTLYYQENLEINYNLIKASYEIGIKNFMNIGSSCMYPKNIPKKIKEKELLNGYLEDTNFGYGLAKLNAALYLNLLRKNSNINYFTIIPCNLFGENDNFNPKSSHLIPAIIKKIFDLKKSKRKIITIWGDGQVKREFLYVDDIAVFITKIVNKKIKPPAFLNVGYGKDFTITQFYKMVMKITNCDYQIRYEKSKPSGMKRKLIDSSLAKNKYSWKPKNTIIQGINKTIDFYEKNYL